MPTAFDDVHLFENFDCVYLQRSCNVTNLECINLLQEQVDATLLDLRNVLDLKLHYSWSTWSRLSAPARYGYYRDWWGQEFRCVNWRHRLNRRCQWFLMTSAATALNSLDLSSAEIADREIKTWKTLSQGQKFSRRVALRCCAFFSLVGSEPSQLGPPKQF